MNRSTICKLSIACAVCCGVISGLSIAPLVVAAIFALVAFICLLGCTIIFIVGMFVWLFSVGQANIFGYASTLADFGLGLFNFITPVAKFSFTYITPIAGWIAVGMGVLGIILSSVGISIAKKQQPQTELQGNPLGASYSLSTYGAPGASTDKKQHVKKKKTNKGACTASLVVCIVFSVVAIIAICLAAWTITMF